MSSELHASDTSGERAIPATYAPPDDKEAKARADEERKSRFWYMVLAEGHPGLLPKRFVLPLLPSAPRCRLCALPFGGVGKLFTHAGWHPCEWNPHYCALCDSYIEAHSPARATVTLPLVYVDLSDSTRHSSQPGYPALQQAFREVVSEAVHDAEGFVIEKFGDCIIGVFPPGMSGLTRHGVSPHGDAVHDLRDVLAWKGAVHDFPRHLADALEDLLKVAVGQVGPTRSAQEALAFATTLAIECATKLVRETAPRFWETHGSTFRAGVHVDAAIFSVIRTKQPGPQLPVTVAGPIVSIAARLAARARRGEALVSDDALRIAGISLDGCEQMSFEPDAPGDMQVGAPHTAAVTSSENALKGVTRPLTAWVIAADASGDTAM